MAKIIENKKGRRQIKLNFADIQSVIAEYQSKYKQMPNISKLKNFFEYYGIYLPEDI